MPIAVDQGEDGSHTCSLSGLHTNMTGQMQEDSHTGLLHVPLQLANKWVAVPSGVPPTSPLDACMTPLCDA
jgi:hypothetical protein